MLVSLGCALFVIIPLELGVPLAEVSRVVQGVAAGIGFIGAGAILKLSEQQEIQGLTTAAGIWMTAAVGVTVGFGSLGIALLSVILAWIILAIIGRIEQYAGTTNDNNDPNPSETGSNNPKQKRATDPNAEDWYCSCR